MEMGKGNKAPITYKARVAKVMETGSRGMERGDKTHITAVKMAISAIVLTTFDFLAVIFSLGMSRFYQKAAFEMGKEDFSSLKAL